MGWLYPTMVHGVGVPLFKYVLRAKLTGADVVPAQGGVIIASNHLAALDPLVIASLLGRPMVFPAKAELFQGKGVKRLMAAWLRGMGQAPIDRSGGAASADALRHLDDTLRAGGVVGIFPEGTRSPDGRLYQGHTGVARLALETGAPVIPVGLHRTPIERGVLGFPTMRHARIRFGDPLDVSVWRDRRDDPAVLRRVTDEVMAAIQRLSGQAYVDVYASRVKRGGLRGAELEAYARPGPGVDAAPPSDASLHQAALPRPGEPS